MVKVVHAIIFLIFLLVVGNASSQDNSTRELGTVTVINAKYRLGCIFIDNAPRLGRIRNNEVVKFISRRNVRKISKLPRSQRSPDEKAVFRADKICSEMKYPSEENGSPIAPPSDPNIPNPEPTSTPETIASSTPTAVATNTPTPTPTPTSTAENLIPVATVSSPPYGQTGVMAYLDGSQSSDPENSPLTYLWSIVTAPVGSNATLASPDQPIASFIPDVVGNYTIELLVNDGSQDSVKVQQLFYGYDGNGDIASGPCSNSLVFYYEHEEQDDSVALDSSANGYHSICIDYALYPGHTCPQSVPGFFGLAKDCANIQEAHYTLPVKSNQFYGSSFTMSAWVNPRGKNNSDKMTIFDQQGPSSTVAINLYIDDTTHWNGGRITCAFDPDSDLSHREKVTSPSFPWGEWQYVTCTHDADARELALYMNHSSCGSRSDGNGYNVCKVASKITTRDPRDSGQPIGECNYAIVGEPGPSTFDDKNNGLVDEAKFLNRALTKSEVESDYDLFITGKGGLCRQ